MEMDSEDGTEFVLDLSVDVNKNRAEGIKTHTPKAHVAHTHRVSHKGPNQSRATSGKLNGFLQAEDPKSTSGAAGNICTPGAGGEIHRNRGADGADVGPESRTNPGADNGEVVDLPRFGSDSTPRVGGTPGTGRANHSCCSIPSHGSPGAADVWEVHANTLVLGGSSGDYSTSAETSATPGHSRSRSGTGDTWDGEDADVWEFQGSVDVVRETSGELPKSRWPEETSRPSDPNTGAIIANNLVETEGNWNSSFTSGKSEGTRGTRSSPDAVVEASGNDADQSTSGETASGQRPNPDPVGGNVSVLDAKTAASVTEDLPSVKDIGVSRVVAGTMDVPLQRNKAEWEITEVPVRPQACGGKCVRTCCSGLEMKIPNGHVDFGEGEGVRVGNHGFLVINRRSFSETASIPVYSIREPRNAGEPPQEPRSCSDPGPETISKRSAVNVNEDVSTQKTTGADGVGVAVERPRTLRTNPGQMMSLSCDSTPLNLDNAGYFIDDGDLEMIMNSLELGRRQSAPEELPESQHRDSEPSADRTASRRHGFTEFLTRSLFSWKPRDVSVPSASSGWRIFGKMSPKGSESGASGTPAPPPRPPPLQSDAVRRKTLDFEPVSTTGLILEDRPANLPAKSEEEAQRHRQQYNEMISVAKRRELKEAQRKKKQMKERHRQEESIARAVVVWNTEILPNWENMRNTRRVRELWYQGLPPSIRGKIWSLAIGNELNITAELYEIFLSRAKEKWRSYSETGSLSENEDGSVDRESSLDLIKLDIFRTFPSLCIFQKGGPYHDVLHNVLGAYTCYRPDVGYVQGMSFIAAVLILNLEEADAFIAFANLLNKPCQMAFFRVDHDLMLKYFAAFEVFFQENLPKLFQHFQSTSLTPDFYLIDWIFTLYSKPLPLDVACRVWDLFCRDGEEALFRTALGILRLYQDVLMQMDFIHSAQFLSRLLQNTPAHTLFTCIANTHMLSNNRRWNQVFSALMKDGWKEADKTGSPALRS